MLVWKYDQSSDRPNGVDTRATSVAKKCHNITIFKCWKMGNRKVTPWKHLLPTDNQGILFCPKVPLPWNIILPYFVNLSLPLSMLWCMITVNWVGLQKSQLSRVFSISASAQSRLFSPPLAHQGSPNIWSIGGQFTQRWDQCNPPETERRSPPCETGLLSRWKTLSQLERFHIPAPLTSIL